MTIATLWTCVRVHIVAGNDVNTYIGWWATGISSLASRYRNGRFTATIMEKIHVSVAKVAICDAIDDIMKARFGETNPGRRIK